MGVAHLPRGRSRGLLLLPALVLAAAAGGCASTTPDRTAPRTEPPPVSVGKPPATDHAPADLQHAGDLIVSRTNGFRHGQGLGSVNQNSRLSAAARSFAGYMARTARYGHTADGRTPAERAQEQGYEYCLVSENIAYQYSSAGFATDALAQGFVTGWKNSPEHRENMLDPDVTETAVAVARSPNGTYYAVQMFGRPRSMQVEFKVTNRAGVPVSYTLGGQTFPLPPRVTRTHTVCRPPKVDFAWPRDERPQGADGGDVFSPRNGSHYVVERDPGRRFAVRPQAQAPQ
jgi:uncharacterized protein YkwD